MENLNQSQIFLNRVNPKDINKLQLEGLTKAGAFDSISNNRRSFYDSIPNLILKSKNIFENKSQNQIELFSKNDNDNEKIIDEKPEWKFQEKMLKEFETIGFYLSDHPLNQYKNIFDEYNITKYSDFISNKNPIRKYGCSNNFKNSRKKNTKRNIICNYKIFRFRWCF